MSRDELNQFFARQFPQATMIIDEANDDVVRVRQPIAERHLRPGHTVSGPVMMAVADTAAYALLLARIGEVPLAVTTNLNIHFMRRPSADRAILGEGRALKLGKRLAIVEVELFSEGNPDMVAHATVTYSIPPDRGAS